jgi:LPXTG-site transpeptidase (sortase) family protein
MQQAENKGNIKKSPVLHGALLAFPFILIFAALVLASVWGFDVLRREYPIFSLAVRPQHNAALPNLDAPPSSGSEPSGDEAFYPIYSIGTQWGVMNIDGWEKQDIPLLFGDSKKLLKKGAGTWPGSRLCGQDGKLVMCAHVTTWFNELEDITVGTNVTIETDYGTYVYRVKETLVFHKSDHSVLKNTDGEETLVLYTCYPRKNGYRYRTERFAAICELVEGQQWVQR